MKTKWKQALSMLLSLVLCMELLPVGLLPAARAAAGGPAKPEVTEATYGNFGQEYFPATVGFEFAQLTGVTEAEVFALATITEAEAATSDSAWQIAGAWYDEIGIMTVDLSQESDQYWTYSGVSHIKTVLYFMDNPTPAEGSEVYLIFGVSTGAYSRETAAHSDLFKAVVPAEGQMVTCTRVGEQGGGDPALKPTITTGALTDATFGNAYTATLTGTAVNGGALTWSIVSNTLPNGLSLSENGEITGTPLEAGSRVFTVKLAEENAGYTTLPLTLTVGGPRITTSSLEKGTMRKSYSVKLTGSAVGGGTLSWSLDADSSLPNGLGLSEDGVISGIPTEAGNYHFTVKMTETLSTGETASATETFYLRINEPDSYSVWYDLYGGYELSRNSCASRTVRDGTTITLPQAEDIARQGYNFVTWREEDGTEYAAGAQVLVNRNLHFTAVWTEKASVRVQLPDGMSDLVGQVSLEGTFTVYRINGDSAPANITIERRYYASPVTPAFWISFSRYSDYTFSDLRLYAYVDGKNTQIASYSGAVTENSGTVTLVPTDGLSFVCAKDIVVDNAELTKDTDYTVSAVLGHGGGAYGSDITLSVPFLTTGTSNGKDYRARIGGVDLSPYYADYNWSKTYDTTFRDGVFHVTLDEVKPDITVTGSVSYGETPVPGASVTIVQYREGQYRNHTVVTGLDGTFSTPCFSGGAEYYVKAGEQELAHVYSTKLKDGDVLTVRTEVMRVAVCPTLDSTLYDAATSSFMRSRAYPEITLRENGKKITSGRVYYLDNTQAWSLYGLSGINTEIEWEMTGENVVSDSGTIKVENGVAEPVAPKLKLKPSIRVHLSADITGAYALAWFDAAGNYTGQATSCTLYGQRYGVSGKGDTYLSLAPSGAGSYTLALMPAAYAKMLTTASKLSDVSGDTDKCPKMWTVSGLGEYEQRALEEFEMDSAASNNAMFVTKPNSTMTAGQESVSSVNNLVTFSGNIGLDSGLRNGKLKTLYIQTEDSVQSLTVGGKSYPASKISNHQLTFDEDSAPSLPCRYILYCKPKSLDRNMGVAMYADVWSENAGSYDEPIEYQPIGDAVVERAGAYIKTLSNHVCSDTITVEGTSSAIRYHEDGGYYDEVSIYDCGVLIGTVRAGWSGNWSAKVKLHDTDSTLMTTHIITYKTETGTTSHELIVFHDPKGPELRSVDSCQGDPDTLIPISRSFGPFWHNEEDIYFKAVFKNGNKLKKLEGWNAYVLFRYTLNSGEIGYVPAANDEAGDVYTTAKIDRLNGTIQTIEAFYEPKDLNNGATLSDDGTDDNFVMRDSTLDGYALVDNEMAKLLEKDFEKTSASSFTVSYDSGAAAVSGAGTSISAEANAEIAEAYKSYAEDMKKDGLAVRSLSVQYDDQTGILDWLRQTGATWRDSNPETEGLFTYTATYNTKDQYQTELGQIKSCSGWHRGMDSKPQAKAVVSIDQYTFTDIEQDSSGNLTGTYHVAASALCDETNGVYTIELCMTLTPDFKSFKGIESLTGDAYYRTAVYQAPLVYADGAHPLKPRKNTTSTFSQNMGSNSGHGSYWVGLVGAGGDLIGKFAQVSRGLGLSSGALAVLNQITETNNYVNRLKDNQKLGSDILAWKNSPCFGNLDKKTKEDIANSMMAFESNRLTAEKIDTLNTGIFTAANAITVASLIPKLGIDTIAGLCAGTIGYGLSYGVGKLAGSYQDAMLAAYDDVANKCLKAFTERAMKYNDKDCLEYVKNTEAPANDKKYQNRYGGGYDPSGIVFEGVIENPVENATATLYYATDTDGTIIRLDENGNPAKLRPDGQFITTGVNIDRLAIAENVDNMTPDTATQTTGTDGYYSWLVPEGLWYVTADAAGYESGSSNDDKEATVNVTVDGKSVSLLPVLPVQLDVNIPLTDKAVPTVTDVKYTTDGVYVTYSKYMMEGIGADSCLNDGNYTVAVTGADGSPKASGFTVESVEQGTVPANLKTNGGQTRTRTVLLSIPGLAAGDEVSWSVKSSVASYAGTPLGADYLTRGTAQEKQQLAQPVFTVTNSAGATVSGSSVSATVPYGTSVTLSAGDAGIDSVEIWYSLDGTSWNRYQGELALCNHTDILAEARAVGYETSEQSDGQFLIDDALQFIATGKITTEDGGSAEGLTITLSDNAGNAWTDTVTEGFVSFPDTPVGTYTASFAGSADYAATSTSVTVKDNKVLFVLNLPKASSGQPTLTASPSALTLTAGKTGTVTLTRRDKNGNPVADSMIQAVSYNTAAATVTASAVTNASGQAYFTVSGVSAGNATLTFTAGDLTATVSVTVQTAGSGGGSGSGSGSSGSSGSGGSSSGTANPLVSVPVSGGKTTFNAVVLSNVVDMTLLTESQATAIVEASAGAGTVTLDCSSLGKEITAVSIPAKSFKALAQAINDPSTSANSLTIKLPDGIATFDAKAIAAISDRATGFDIWFNLVKITTDRLRIAQREALKGKDVQQCYDIYLTSDGREIGDFKGGTVELTMNFTPKSGQSAAKVELWYVSDDGKTVEEIPAECDGKTVKSTVGHFSCYAIVYNPNHAESTSEPTPEPAPEKAPCPKDASCPVSAFTDADVNAWYHDGVHYALANGIMSGMGGGTFAPNGTTTRAMMAQMLWNLEGKTACDGALAFIDTDDGAWYAGAVRWANTEGIMGGVSPRQFAPNAPLTREQLVTILYRYAKDKGIDVSAGGSLSGYRDADSVSAWAADAMRWAVGIGLVTGKTATTLNPADSATRAEIATILMRYCENVAKA